MNEDEWKRETLVRHVAKLPKHQINQWLASYEAKHKYKEGTSELRSLVREEHLNRGKIRRR